MEYDNYLVEMYKKLINISKASFSDFLVSSNNTYSKLTTSLKSIKDSISTSEWKDLLKTSSSSNIEKLQNQLNQCSSYPNNVVSPLAEESEVLIDRLRKYVEEKNSQENKVPIVVDNETFYKNFFENINGWVNDPNLFTTEVNKYFIPKQEWQNDSGFLDSRLFDIYNVIKSVCGSNSVQEGQHMLQYLQSNHSIDDGKISGSLSQSQYQSMRNTLNGQMNQYKPSYTRSNFKPTHGTNDGSVSDSEAKERLTMDVEKVVKEQLERFYDPNYSYQNDIEAENAINQHTMNNLAIECYESIKRINEILGNTEAVAAISGIISDLNNKVSGVNQGINNGTGVNGTVAVGDSGKGSSASSDSSVATAIAGVASVTGSNRSGSGIENYSEESVPMAIESATKEEDIDESNHETRVHFIRTNTSDATLIESEGEFGLIDAANPTSGVWAESSNNGQTVMSYLNSIGVTHLKFVILSHAHSDHAGGLPDIANSNLVDSTTTFIYKDLSRDSSRFGEIVLSDNGGYETAHFSDIGTDWFSFDILNNAKNCFTNKGAVMLETSSHSADKLAQLGATYAPGVDRWTDCIAFKMGKLMFSIYNLPYYSETENGNKYLDINTNSLVTIITSTTGKRLWLSGDLNARSEFESYYAKRIGKVDLFKANHHGYYYSNSYGLLSRIKPTYTVIPNSIGTCGSNVYPAYSYLKSIGSNIFYAGENAVVFTINNAIIPSRGPDSVSIPNEWYRWVDEDAEMKWVYIEGGNLTYGFKNINGNDYYFNSKGLMVTGWEKIDGTWYYFDKTASKNQGIMKKNGWIQDEGDWYYLGSDGKTKTNDWVQDNGYWYYLGSDGKMQKNSWVDYKGEYYYVDGEGKMKTSSWINDNGTWYYVDSEGKMKKNDWIEDSGSWYYLSSDGKMKTSDWVQSSGSWYYLGSDGKMQKSSWVNDKGSWYYVDSEGKMKSNSWVQDGSEWYYVNGEGKMITNDWIQDGSWYYLGSSGAMVKNTTMTIDGTSYTFNSSGACL